VEIKNKRYHIHGIYSVEIITTDIVAMEFIPWKLTKLKQTIS